MGGPGSGWQEIKKATVDQCLILSIKDLANIGALDPGWRDGSLSWRSGEEHAAALEFHSCISLNGTGTLWLRYMADGKLMYYTVSLISSVPNYGGRRWWFKCPVKQIRLANLYLPPGATEFASRRAHNLSYRSCQQSGSDDRIRRRLVRLARRLGRSEAELRGFLN